MRRNISFYFTTLYFLNISVYKTTRSCPCHHDSEHAWSFLNNFTTVDFSRTTALHGVKDWWFNVVPRATGCSTVLNNAAGNRQVAHARNLQAEILLCCTGVCCCRLLHVLHSEWGFLDQRMITGLTRRTIISGVNWKEVPWNGRHK